MTDHRDLKQGVKNQFRESASALLKMITKQIAQIAELNGRLLEEHNFLKTKEQVQAKIDVRKIKIGIKNVRNIKEGGILIETISEKDLDKLIQHLKEQDELKENFNINKPTARKPHIICFDISPDTEEKALLDSLQEQFSEGTESKTDFAIKHHFKSRRGVNWIIEVDPTIWSKVTATRKLNLGWERINFREYLRPV
ncbi:uncharacterized protein CEXT_312971 [Caerostris extrusa]|uniref:Uncharacterized protein n=1 Tax=Caerostris extrusa TaxID=172846 RepID=A0AAV4MC52_CAEEX|nr:uncharacterized protein CEXT_312971 [Caerostris extrusa]